MNNKGQITVFMSFLILILLLLTFSAYEVIRLYTGKIKARACVHSMRTSIMADYDSELFSRYHLLFLDSTYGTGSNAFLETKAIDYLDVSLNGEEKMTDKIYEYSIDELMATDEETILDDNMKLLKEEILEYEKMGGLKDRVKDIKEKIKERPGNSQAAYTETENNAVEVEQTDGEGTESEEQVEDPRDKLKSMLQGGILNLVMPGNNLSSTAVSLGHASLDYEQEQDTSFTDIDSFKRILRDLCKKDHYEGLDQEIAFLNYVSTHFSNGVHQYDDTVLICEMEYLLEGKNNDVDNMKGVVNDLLWMRMLSNYSYLITDASKKKEAEVLAGAICVATGTEPLEKVVKYLLLGCWSYGESIYDVKDLLAGKKLPFAKNSQNWKTDLKSLACTNSQEASTGLDYEDYLILLFVKNSITNMDTCYSRMLDVMEINLQQNNPNFQIKNCVGRMKLQGKVVLEKLYSVGGNAKTYEYYFDEILNYTELDEE